MSPVEIPLTRSTHPSSRSGSSQYSCQIRHFFAALRSKLTENIRMASHLWTTLMGWLFDGYLHVNPDSLDEVVEGPDTWMTTICSFPGPGMAIGMGHEASNNPRIVTWICILPDGHFTSVL